MITRLPGESHSARYSSRTLETVNHHLNRHVKPSVTLAPAGRAACGRAGLVADGDRRLTPAGHEGRPKTGPSPVDRARTGSKHHLIEAHGIPLQASLTGGNRNDVTQLMLLIQDIPPVRGRRGRPRRRPDTVYADRAYDHDKYRKQVRAVGVTPVISRRGTGHGSGLGQYRWVVEQTFALLHWFRRLRIRWEIRDDIHEAFLRLACASICLRRLTSLSPC